MEIRWIASDADYERALREIRKLWKPNPTRAARGKMELLAMLAHRYERERAPLPDLTPVEAIKFRMEQQGLSRKDLLPIFGTPARVSEVLSGKRALTLDMIRRLHSTLGIALETLVQPLGVSRTKAEPKKTTPKKRTARAA